MTYWIVLAIAGYLSWLSLRRYNIAFAIAGTLSWFAVWGYHTTNPPTNIVAGTFVYDILYYAYIVMGIAIMFIYLSGRTGSKSKASLTVEDGKIVAESSTQENVPSGLEEYRATMRRAVRRRR